MARWRTARETLETGNMSVSDQSFNIKFITICWALALNSSAAVTSKVEPVTAASAANDNDSSFPLDTGSKWLRSRINA